MNVRIIEQLSSDDFMTELGIGLRSHQSRVSPRQSAESCDVLEVEVVQAPVGQLLSGKLFDMLPSMEGIPELYSDDQHDFTVFRRLGIVYLGSDD